MAIESVGEQRKRADLLGLLLSEEEKAAEAARAELYADAKIAYPCQYLSLTVLLHRFDRGIFVPFDQYPSQAVISKEDLLSSERELQTFNRLNKYPQRAELTKQAILAAQNIGKHIEDIKDRHDLITLIEGSLDRKSVPV